MKRLLITMMIVCTSASFGFSQTEQGNLMLGGEISFSSSSGEREVSGPSTTRTDEYFDNKRSQFSIMPRAGYFISDGFAVGLGIGYTSSTVERNDTTSTTTGIFRVAPFGRYYAPISDNISFFGQAEFAFGTGSDDADPETSITELDFGISPGFTIFASDKVGINFILPSIIRYQSRQEETERNNTTTTITRNNLDVNLGLNGIGFGVDLYL